MKTHPLEKTEKLHGGVDFSADSKAKIIATARGTVVEISNSETGYGNVIVIQHGEDMKTRYAHLQSIFVKEGQEVHQGQEIGLFGNNGNSLTPHLHYEILKNEVPKNPNDFFLLE